MILLLLLPADATIKSVEPSAESRTPSPPKPAWSTVAFSVCDSAQLLDAREKMRSAPDPLSAFGLETKKLLRSMMLFSRLRILL